MAESTRRIDVLLRAARRAKDMEREHVVLASDHAPTVLRGAPSHTGAALLRALDEQGWTLVEKGELDARDERVLDLEAEVERLNALLDAVADRP